MSGHQSATPSAVQQDEERSPSSYCVLLFYKYHQGWRFVDPLQSVDRLLDHQKRLCEKLHLKGRLLLAQEGVNGTLSGLRDDIEAYIRSMKEYREEVLLVTSGRGVVAAAMAADELATPSPSLQSLLPFDNVDWKLSDMSKMTGIYQEPFPDLKISIVKEIVSTGGLIQVDDLAETGHHLSPKEFHEALCGKDSANIALIDVRNTFEHNIGHFKNPSTGEKAMDPAMVTFSSFDKFCEDHAQELKDRKVLMYCTGGIRCEKASVMLKRKGVKDVHQLSGGIHRYLEKYGPDGHFCGVNFTFDKRVAVKPTTSTTSPEYEVVGRCLECDTAFDELCGSRVCTVCRDLVLICPDCQRTLREYHCQRHAQWKMCYFTFLDIFDRDQLLEQRQGLVSLRDTIYVPAAKHKNVRRTLSRQIEKVDKHIQWMDDNQQTKGMVDPPRRCRTCMEPSTVCDGRCWGFWKTDGTGARTTTEVESCNEQYLPTSSNRPLPVAVGDRVQPGNEWNSIRLGNKHDSNGTLRSGVVVEVKSWAGSDEDCVAVMWDDMNGIGSRNLGKVQPQIYRWGVLAANGYTRLYDVCKKDGAFPSTHRTKDAGSSIRLLQHPISTLMIVLALAGMQMVSAFVPLHRSHDRHLRSSRSSLELDNTIGDANDNFDRAERIMYNQLARKREETRYQIIAAEACEALAIRMATKYPDRFTFHATEWSKFPDGTDNIEIGGFSSPRNVISGEHVLFLASFHNNDVTLSQFQVMICLLLSFVESLTVVLPFSPVGTMERVTREGQVATAATYAHMFSSLPNCGRPTRLMVYDLHTLQNRFYLHGNAVASLQTAIPLLKDKIKERGINCVAFPDDGAAKRFSSMFQDMGDAMEIIVCGKTRGEGDQRTVTIQDGNATDRHIVIVDDLVQTGGTLYETGKVLEEAGAASVNAFVTHGVFPKESWKRFNKGGDRACFQKFWVTNSIPTVTDKLPVHDGVFEVLDLMDLIICDLDHYSCA